MLFASTYLAYDCKEGEVHMIAQRFLIIILVGGVLCIASCSRQSEPTTETSSSSPSVSEHAPQKEPAGGAVKANDIAVDGKRSMKGWELYAWPSKPPVSEGWTFALVMGTNIYKTEEMIKHDPIQSLDELEVALSSIMPGEFIVHWPRFGFPPHELIEMIAAICEERGVRFSSLDTPEG